MNNFYSYNFIQTKTKLKMGNEVEEADKKINIENIDGEEDEKEEPKLELQPMSFYL